ncbi:NAD(P)H nitroreductase [Pseudomonas marincola]|uniref:NAD(P)H nitroreductase n=1 Tax=Pseudomonas marincola TaxID=437900 RepID=UPI0008EB4CBF|nr:NAD(P)H nitroreductase [Pseudomonas marincola]SFT77210.1 Nitroreductase [Pseudomonas marincola]
MDALDALLNRVSAPRLTEPGPTAEQRELMFKAALRAPDHGQLRPWRFLTIEDQAREQLGELFVQALLAGAEVSTQAALDKARAMPLRAPLMIVVIAVVQDHYKVPAQEQVLAAGCAAHAIELAAYAQGVGVVWRTGDMAYNSTVAAGLGLASHEQIVGYLYLGTPERELRTPAPLECADFVTSWSAKSQAE